jgi:hypothetical protein
MKGFFDIQKYGSRRHVTAEIEGHVVRSPHTMKCRAVTGTETKLACIKQTPFLNVPLDSFKLTFFNNLPAVDKGLIRRKFWGGILGPYRVSVTL